MSELEAEIQRYRDIIDASPSALVLVNPTGEIVLVNRATERLFGYAREELLGNSVEMLVPASVRGSHHKYRESYLATPEPRMMGQGRDLYGMGRDGEEIPIEVGLTPIHMPDGTHVLSAIIDLTYRKQAEEALARQADELARSNAELEQFAYVASHDLQEPLRMVRSYTELMERHLGQDLDEKSAKAMKYVVEGAERMQLLIDDLLLYSRVGRGELDIARVDVNAVVNHVVNLLSVTLTEQPGASITWDELPTVRASESMLVQLFQNLIFNGLKFHGEEPARVHVSCEEKPAEWLFHVQDNGIGIDPQYAERVFQVFQRLHERDRYPGTGIGLAVAKRIVERHGGRIGFESQPGAGTRFHVTLPRTPRTGKGESP
ncbi:sensor histidine kinase [Vreelandella utahensis]|uniref:sensor histidine kinase n=1 Tax=Vreelandella halophila TaxID=86177 RepID=UPI0015C3F15A|nr:PAS domain-containing sensor histidine kinase [Halomonas utahensis]